MASIIDLDKITNKIVEIISDKYQVTPTIYENLNYKNINIEDLIKTTTYLLNLKKSKTDITPLFLNEKNKNIFKDLYTVGLKTITKNDFTEKQKLSINTAESKLSLEDFLVAFFSQYRKLDTIIVVPDNEETDEVIFDIKQILETNDIREEKIETIVNNIQTYPEININELSSISDISVYINKNYY